MREQGSNESFVEQDLDADHSKLALMDRRMSDKGGRKPMFGTGDRNFSVLIGARSYTKILRGACVL